MSRIRYCDTCGRITDDEIREGAEQVGLLATFAILRLCDHCWRWYHRMSPFRAKRAGES